MGFSFEQHTYTRFGNEINSLKSTNDKLKNENEKLKEELKKYKSEIRKSKNVIPAVYCEGERMLVSFENDCLKCPYYRDRTILYTADGDKKQNMICSYYEEENNE